MRSTNADTPGETGHGTGAIAPATEAGMITVVIPTFNRAQLLVETLESVAQSDWPSIEIVVADDGSTDDTADRVTEFSKRHPQIDTRYLQLAHGGAIAARNAGVEAGRGEFVYFLDSDDLLLPDGLSALARPLSDPAIPYSVAQLAEADLSGNRIYAEGQVDSRIDSDGVVGSEWSTIVGLYRRSVFERLGAFDAALEYGEDKEFLWRIVAGCMPGMVIDDVIALRRNHQFGQITDEYTPAMMGKQTIAALDAFTAWAERTDRFRPAIARAASRRLWIATVRAGATGEKRWVQIALALSARLEPAAPSLRDRALRAVFSVMPRIGFSALLATMTMARSLLHAVRNARRRQRTVTPK